MNAPIKIAQVGAKPGAKEAKIVKLTKPADNQAVTVELSYDQSIKIDFSEIANEKIIIVRVGERAVILFDNGGTVTLDPFFDSLRRPLANLEFEFAPGKVLTAIELAGLVPFTDDQSVLPAAGEGGDPRDAGANFDPAIVQAIGPVVIPGLPGYEELPGIDFTADIGGLLVTPLTITGTIFGLVEEEQFTGNEQQSDAGPGNEDINDANGLDTDELPPDNITLHIEAELAPLVSGGTPPYSFELIDPTLDADPENDFVHDTDSNGVVDRIKSQGADVKFKFIDSTTIEGWADDGGDGSLDRLVFTLTLDNTTGHLEFDLNDQIDHPLASFDDGTNLQGIFEELLALNLSSVIEISDSGGQTVNLGDVPGEPVVAIGVIDDTPILNGEVESRIVDEDDIYTWWSQGTSPFDGTGDGSSTDFDFDTFSFPAFISGDLGAIVSIGADAHPEGSPAFSFTAGAIDHMLSLGLFSKQTALPENGESLFYTIEDTGTTLILRAFEPDPDVADPGSDPENPDLGDTGNIVFELTLNKFTGEYEFRLFDELIHMPPPPGGSEENTDLRSGDPDPVQLSVEYLDFGNIIQVTDYDGDSILLGDSFKIYVTDDVPDADLDVKHGDALTHDETPNDTQGPDDVDFIDLPLAVRNAFSAVTNPGNDPDVGDDNGAIGYARDTDLIEIDFGPFDTEIGADSPPLALAVTLAIVGGDDTPSGLFTTEGFPIHLFLEDGLVVGRVQGGAFDGQAAFALHIEDDGDISLAQWLSILHDDINDHDESNDNGFNSGDNSPNQFPEPIQQTLSDLIKAVLTVTDSDGDTATDEIDIGHLIRFEDDGPTVKHGKEEKTVDEDDIDTPLSLGTSPNDGNADGSYTGNPANGLPGPAFVSGSIGGFVDFGADGKGGFSIAIDQIANEFGGLGLRSQGVLLTYSGDNSDPTWAVFTAEAGVREVFELRVNKTTGEYEFRLFDQLDHDPGNGENFSLVDSVPGDIDELDFGGIIRATDGDGDYVDLDGKLKIEIRDDVPEYTGQTASIRVEEDELAFADGDLSDGITDNDGFTDEATFTAADLNALVDVGADEPLTWSLKDFFPLASNAVRDTGNNIVTSYGATVNYLNIGGGVVIGYADANSNESFDGGEREVFRITDLGGGNFLFDLKDQIDHLGNGDNETLTINLTPAFVGEDFDHDEVSLPANTITVDVENDVPMVVDCNLIVNGSFEEGHGLGSPDWNIYMSVPGWTWGADLVPFEIQTGGVGGLAAQDGNALVELDGDTGLGIPHTPQGTPDPDDSNATIQQTIATDAGQTYELTFWYAPRPGSQGDGDSSSMEVLWDGAVVHTIDSSTAPAGWQQITLYLTAADASTVLGFRGTGEENEFGAFIDNVALCAIGVVDEDGLDTAYSVGIGDVQPGDVPGNETVATGDLMILWGADDGDEADAGGTQDGALTSLSGRNVVFTDTDVEIEGVADLKSHGDDVTFVLAENGTKLLGIADQGGDDERTVIEVKLLDDGSGSYRLEIFDQLDHAPGEDENDIILGFDFTATDSDGDAAGGHFKVLVDDDLPIVTGEVCPEVGGDVEPGKVANFVLALDSSGSVEGGQLTLIKNNTIDFLNDLAASGAQDVRVHIVDFDNNSKVVGTFDIIVGGVVQDDPGDAKGDQLQAAIDAVNALTSGGSEFTNYEAGLSQAKEWIDGGTVAVTNAHSFDADTIFNLGDDNDNTAFVLTDSNGVRIAVVSAWEPFASNTLDDASGGISGGFGEDGGELNETDEMLRFDFGEFDDIDGAGEFGLAGEAVGFRGSDVSAATFSFRGFDVGDTVTYQIFLANGGGPSGLIDVNIGVSPLLNFVISAPPGALIDRIEFTVPAGSDGLIDLESVVIGNGPLLDADVNEVIFFSDGEPNRALESDGDVFDPGDEQDAVNESLNEISAIETDGDLGGPEQDFNIRAFGANAGAGGLGILNQIDTAGAAVNITTDTGLGDALATLLASLGGGGGGGGDVVNFDLGPIVDPGADEDVTFSWKTDFTPLEDQGLQSGGVDLIYELDGDTLIAHTGNPLDPVFTVLLNDDGTGTFTLVDNLDDTDGGGDGEVHVDFSGMVLAVDYDLDPAAFGPNAFCFEIETSTPIEARGFSGGVEEDDLLAAGLYPASFDGNPDDDDADGADNDEDPPPTIGTNFLGDFAGTVVGGDGTYVFSLNPALVDGSQVALVGGGFLQSQGEDVIIDVADSQFLYGFVDSNGNNTFDDATDDRLVFTFEVNPAGGTDSDWIFSLFDHVDHPTPTANSTAADEESIFLDLTGYVFVDDEAGQTATMDGVMRVIDDVPVSNLATSTQNNYSSIAVELDETVQPDGDELPGYDRYNGDVLGEGESLPTLASNGGADDVDPGADDDVYNRTPAVETDPDGSESASSEAIGSLTTAAGGLKGLFFNIDPVFGADGPAADDDVIYDLKFVFGGGETLSTNLFATDTGDPLLTALSDAERAIYLFKVSDTVVEGRLVGADGPGGDTSDEYVAFRLTLNNADDPDLASITVDHFLAIDHDLSDDSDPAIEDPSVFDENIVLKLLQGQSLGLQIDVTATDGDGDSVSKSATATLADVNGSFVSFDDDGPKALDDTDDVGTGTTATGNVLTGIDILVGFDANLTDGVADNAGTDGGGKLIKIVSDNTANEDAVPNGSGDFEVTGQFGTLVINENGDYTYTRSSNSAGTEVFTYTLTDGDGDLDTATLTIDLDTIDIPFEDPAEFLGIVEEEHLNNFNAAFPGDDSNIEGSTGNEDFTSTPDGDDNPATADGDDDVPGTPDDFDVTTDVTSGQLTISGGNGTLTWSYEVTDGTAVFFGDAPGLQVYSKGAPVHFVRDPGDPNILYGVANDDGGPDDLETDDRIVFKIELDPTDGSFVFTLIDQIDHHPYDTIDGPPPEFPIDDVEGIMTIDLAGVFKVEDEDFDQHVFQNVAVKVIDDIPEAFTPQSVEIENSNGSSGTAFLDVDEDVDDNVGADEPGTITFANIENGQASGLTSGDQPILLYLVDNDGTSTNDGTNPPTLEGRIGGPAGTLIFTIVLNHDLSGDDTYTVTMSGTIDNFALTEFPAVSTIPAGNADVRLFENFGSLDLDVLFSSADGTINSSGSGVGIGSQSIGVGDQLDIDFLKNGTYADESVDGPGDYQTVNSLTITATQNNPGGNDADMLIRAFDADGNEVQITGIIINSATLVGDAASPDVNADNIDDDGVPSNDAEGPVTAVASGLGYELHGVGGGTGGSDLDNDTITIIAAGGFSRIEITNIGGDGSGQDTFDLSFESVSVLTTNPIELAVDVALTDKDGDSIESTLNITLNPAAPPPNDPPTDIVWNGVVPGENSLPGAGTVIANLTTVDPDNASGHQYQFFGVNSPDFTVDLNTGAVTRVNSGMAQNETYTLNIRSTDAAGSGAWVDETFTILTGNDGNNTLNGDALDNVLYGDDGDDTLNGGAGNDTLFGQDENDTLNGGTGNDFLAGGDNSDNYDFAFTGDGNDTINETGGSGSSDAIRITTANSSAVFTNLNFERVDADGDSNLDDLLVSYNGQTIQVINHYSGAAVEDIDFTNGGMLNGVSLNAGGYRLADDGTGQLDGENDFSFSSRDIIAGTSGNNTLNGGAGADLLFGNDGADTFLFNDGESTVAAPDIIADFEVGVDTLDLSAVDSGPGGGDQNFSDPGNGGFTQNVNLVSRGVTWADDGSGNTIVRADTDGNTATAELMFVLVGVSAASLSSTDFTG